MPLDDGRQPIGSSSDRYARDSKEQVKMRKIKSGIVLPDLAPLTFRVPSRPPDKEVTRPGSSLSS